MTSTPPELNASMCSKAAIGPVGLALNTAARVHRIAAARGLKEYGIYPGQEIILQHLSANGTGRQSALVDAFDLDASTVTRMLQRLQKVGLIERHTDPIDRRATLVNLTEAGTQLIEKISGSMAHLEKLTTARLTRDEQTQLVELLGKIEAALAPCENS